jgi:hypothetical protein
MLNDHGEKIPEALPGHSVIVAGFKNPPEVGLPLYVVKNPDEAKFIIAQRVRR